MMQTREFWGRDTNEALQAVRAALGADALILETLSVPGGNGVDGGERIKVTAAPIQVNNERDAPSPLPGRKIASSTRGGEIGRRQRFVGGGIQEGDDARGWRELSAQLDDLKTLFSWLLPGMKRSSVLGELVAQDLPLDLLIRLLQETDGDAGDERALVRRALLRLVATGGDVETTTDHRTCLALIGPPGTGKTSAIVKLTVHLMRKNARKIGWVSLDNRRVSGAEELTVYAGIVGTPCEVAEGAQGLTRALERLSTCNLVFIDTPGLSPRDHAGLSELAGVLQEQGPFAVRRTLVLSAATNWRNLALWTQYYEQIGYDSLLFSMLDAGGCFGPLLNTVISCGQPLSYLAAGAGVTQGIEVATPESVVDLLLP